MSIHFNLTEDGCRLVAEVDGERWLHPTKQASAEAGRSILATYERMAATGEITVHPREAGWTPASEGT